MLAFSISMVHGGHACNVLASVRKQNNLVLTGHSNLWDMYMFCTLGLSAASVAVINGDKGLHGEAPESTAQLFAFRNDMNEGSDCVEE